MGSFASVKVGSRAIDLHAFTGRVVDQQRSSVTQVTRHESNSHITPGITTHTYSYNKLFLRAENGEEKSLEFEDKGFTARHGERASIIWGIRAGKDVGDYLAVVNHETASFHGIRKAINDSAGPPAYNMLLIVLVIVGCVGLVDLFGGHVGSALFFFAISGAGIYWIYARQKGLLRQVRTAALAMKA
jgi:hypothetical protein